MEKIIYIIASIFCITICLTMGIVLLSIRVRNRVYNSQYQLAKKWLIALYFIGAAGYSLIFYNQAIENYDPTIEIFPFTITFISSVQALLFTYTIIALFRSKHAIYRKALRALIPLLILCLAHFISVRVAGNPHLTNLEELQQNITHPTTLIRLFFVAFYFGLLIRFSVVFIREKRKFCEKIENYFSNTEQIRLRWASVAFALAIIIGILNLVIYTVPTRFYAACITFILGVFYLTFAIQYIKYQLFDALIYYATENNNSPEKTEKTDDKQLERKIDQWKLSQKPYLIQGITIEDVASQLNVNRKTLSSHINSVYGCNFNSWINQMRIEETIAILTREPSKNITEISEMVGFGDKSILCRQFKKYTGETVTSWRNRQKN